MIGGHWFCDHNCKSHIQITDSSELRWHFRAPSCTISSLSEWNPSVSPVIGLGALRLGGFFREQEARQSNCTGGAPEPVDGNTRAPRPGPAWPRHEAAVACCPCPIQKKITPRMKISTADETTTQVTADGERRRERVRNAAGDLYPVMDDNIQISSASLFVIRGIFFAGRGQQGASPLDRPGIFSVYRGGRVVPSVTKTLCTLRPTLH